MHRGAPMCFVNIVKQRKVSRNSSRKLAELVPGSLVLYVKQPTSNDLFHAGNSTSDHDWPHDGPRQARLPILGVLSLIEILRQLVACSAAGIFEGLPFLWNKFPIIA